MDTEREWAIEGWLSTLSWVEDRESPATVDQAISELIYYCPEFANAPSWLVEGVRERTQTRVRGALASG